MVTESVLEEDWFSYRAPNAEQLRNYQAIRSAALAFAKAVFNHTHQCPAQTEILKRIQHDMDLANRLISSNKREEQLGDALFL